MRHGMHFAILLLVFALSIVSAPASGQSSVERPTYTAGDFWAYDLNVLAEFEFPENTTATFDLSGNSTLTIQGSEMRNIRGEVRSVYRATHALRIGATGSVSIDLFGSVTNATFSALISADETAYLDTEGLEVWERHTEFALNVSVELEVSPGVFSISTEANGTIEMAMNYTTNTWSFPLTVGQTGEEAFNATGTSFFRSPVYNITDPLNVTYDSISAPIAFNATTSFEALREETITVPAGTFTTVVVASTPGTAETPIPTNISALAYWSGAVGAPVRYAATNETGEEQVEFVLTSYRYQVAESLSILGLDIAVAIPLLVGIAIVAIILTIVLGRRRRTAMPPPPPPPPGGP